MNASGLIFHIHDTPVYQLLPWSITCFKKGMAIDADGHPFAYHPENTGLDDLVHAGYPGNWWGIATDDASTAGNPVIQQVQDPAPGYYITTTSLVDHRFSYHDTRRYADAATVPYFVLPDRFKDTIALGAIAWIYNQLNGRSRFAIFADVGPDIGEGSMCLAAQLGIDNNPRSGGVDDGILYFIFDASGHGNGVQLDDGQIQELGEQLMQGIDRTSLPELFGRMKQ